MNKLSGLQLDALLEVFNIGAGRAASALSEIVNEEVRLSVPSVEFRHCTELNNSMLALSQAQLGMVTQQFSGAFEAEASLIFTEDSALKIVRDMMGSQISIEELAEFEQEAMSELGNIILNACLSALADMLGFELESTLPSYTVCNAEQIIDSLVGQEDQRYVMILHIDLDIEHRQLNGRLIFLFSSSSLHILCERLDDFLGKI